MSTKRNADLLCFLLTTTVAAILAWIAIETNPAFLDFLRPSLEKGSDLILDLFQPPPGRLLSNALLVILLVTATTAALGQRILGSIPVWLFIGLLWTSDHFGWVRNPEILALFARMQLVFCAATCLMATFLATEILSEFRPRTRVIIRPPRSRPPLTYDLRNRKVVKSQPGAKPPRKKAPSPFE